ncbi:hypothetical protein [Maricaulis sp.]|uniref:hypothetical protein n=1 Tax=Maricaulis sp. TaxID=1486257 RepID=UPI003A9113E1
MTETLVAMVIAMATVVTVMAGLASASESSRAAAGRQQDILALRNIEARLRAGISPNAIADQYPAWRIELLPADRPADPQTGAVLTVAFISRHDARGSDLEVVFLEPGTRAVGGRP